MAPLIHIIKVAGLPFDCILAAERVRSAKPAPKVYQFGREAEAAAGMGRHCHAKLG